MSGKTDFAVQSEDCTPKVSQAMTADMALAMIRDCLLEQDCLSIVQWYL